MLITKLDGKTKRTGIEITDKLHEAVLKKCKERGTRFREATHEAFQLWLLYVDGELEAEPYPYTATRKNHELLEYILENDKKAAESIKTSLRLIAEAIEARQKPTRARRAGGA